jgi:hypothetical protein
VVSPYWSASHFHPLSNLSYTVRSIIFPKTLTTKMATEMSAETLANQHLTRRIPGSLSNNLTEYRSVSCPSTPIFGNPGLKLGYQLQFKKEPRQLSWYSVWLRAGRPGFYSQQEKNIFPPFHRVQIGTTQPSIQSVLGALSPGVKRPGFEANYSSPSSPDVQNGEAIPPPKISPLSDS